MADRYKQTQEHIEARVKSRAGWKHSEETKKLLSRNAFRRTWTEEEKANHSQIVKEWHKVNPRFGEQNPNFKGRMTHCGYILLYCPNHPHARKTGYVYEHRLVMEKTIGRYLTKHEIVHHKDGNKQNNDFRNLYLTTREKHKLGAGQVYQDGYNAGFTAAFLLFMIAKKRRTQ